MIYAKNEKEAKEKIEHLERLRIIKKPRKPLEGRDKQYLGAYKADSCAHALTTFVHRKCGHLLYINPYIMYPSFYCWHCHKRVNVDRDAVDILNKKELDSWIGESNTVIWFEWQ